MNFQGIIGAVAVTSSCVFSTPVLAEIEQVDALLEALSIESVLEIMRKEGLQYGAEIGSDLLPGGAGPEWEAAVDRIYSLDQMTSTVSADFAAALDGDDVAGMVEFFTSEPGRTIIALEVSAREALLDETVEEMSKEAAALAIADELPRIDLLDAYVEANDIVESNVVGALNANFAFYLGLLDGGGFPEGLSESDILADVWSQEDDIRQSTTEWAYSFLYLAYQPLSDEDLQAYIDFSETEAGEQLNQAMFLAFDNLFEGISRKLGQASSRFMSQQEL